jgi:hypothetical protein
MNIRHYFKRKAQKVSIWSKKTFDPTNIQPKLDDNQKKAALICFAMINNHNSELLSSSLSTKRYIKNGDYFIVIEEDKIKIINHVYGYDVSLYGRKMKNIKRAFDFRIDEVRLEMERTILNNVKQSLDVIYTKVKSLK